MPTSSRKQPPSLADTLLAEKRQGPATPERLAQATENSFEAIPRAHLIPIERLAASGDNPRHSFEGIGALAESIAERGLLQPLLVRRDPARPGYYKLIAGERRLQAARRVQGFETAEERDRVRALPCLIRDEDDHDAFADALAENVARADLTRAEIMDALLRLHLEYGWGIKEIARRTGRSQGDVSELINLAKDQDLVPLIKGEVIPASVGGAIRRLPASLRGEAIERVRQGRIKTMSDVARWRRDAAGPVTGALGYALPEAAAPSPDALAPLQVTPTTQPTAERPGGSNSNPLVRTEGGFEFEPPQGAAADGGWPLSTTRQPSAAQRTTREEQVRSAARGLVEALAALRGADAPATLRGELEVAYQALGAYLGVIEKSPETAAL